MSSSFHDDGPPCPLSDDPLGPLNENRKFFIAHLPARVTPKAVREYFSVYGQVNFVKIIYGKDGYCKGYGFLYMLDDRSDAAVDRFMKEKNSRINFMGSTNVFLARHDESRKNPPRKKKGRDKYSHYGGKGSNDGASTRKNGSYYLSSGGGRNEGYKPPSEQYDVTQHDLYDTGTGTGTGTRTGTGHVPGPAPSPGQAYAQSAYQPPSQGGGYVPPSQGQHMQSSSTGLYVDANNSARPLYSQPSQQNHPAYVAAPDQPVYAQQNNQQPVYAAAPVYVQAPVPYQPPQSHQVGGQQIESHQQAIAAPSSQTYQPPAPLTTQLYQPPIATAVVQPYQETSQTYAPPSQVTTIVHQQPYQDPYSAPYQQVSGAPQQQVPGAPHQQTGAPTHQQVGPTHQQVGQVMNPVQTMPSSSTKVFIENLPTSTQPKDVVQFLNQMSMKVNRCTMEYDTDQSASWCYAHVDFASTNDASRAISLSQQNALVFRDRYISASFDTNPPPDGVNIPVGMGSRVSSGRPPSSSGRQGKSKNEGYGREGGGRVGRNSDRNRGRGSRRDRPY